MKIIRLALATLCFFTIVGSQAAQEAKKAVFNDQNLEWGPCPEMFPQGCEVTVLQGDPSQGPSDVFLKFPANYNVPAHTHTSPEHMTLVSGELEVTYQGQQKMTLQEGDYAFGPAKLAHNAKCISKEDCVLMIVFERPIDAFPFKGKL